MCLNTPLPCLTCCIWFRSVPAMNDATKMVTTCVGATREEWAEPKCRFWPGVMSDELHVASCSTPCNSSQLKGHMWWVISKLQSPTSQNTHAALSSAADWELCHIMSTHKYRCVALFMSAWVWNRHSLFF